MVNRLFKTFKNNKKSPNLTVFSSIYTTSRRKVGEVRQRRTVKVMQRGRCPRLGHSKRYFHYERIALYTAATYIDTMSHVTMQILLTLCSKHSCYCQLRKVLLEEPTLDTSLTPSKIFAVPLSELPAQNCHKFEIIYLWRGAYHLAQYAVLLFKIGFKLICDHFDVIYASYYLNFIVSDSSDDKHTRARPLYRNFE